MSLMISIDVIIILYVNPDGILPIWQTFSASEAGSGYGQSLCHNLNIPSDMTDLWL